MLYMKKLIVVHLYGILCINGIREEFIFSSFFLVLVFHIGVIHENLLQNNDLHQIFFSYLNGN